MLRCAAPLTTDHTCAMHSVSSNSIFETTAVVWTPHDNKCWNKCKKVFKISIQKEPPLPPISVPHASYKVIRLWVPWINILRANVDSLSHEAHHHHEVKMLRGRVPNDYCNRRCGVSVLATASSRINEHRHSTPQLRTRSIPEVWCVCDSDINKTDYWLEESVREKYERIY